MRAALIVVAGVVVALSACGKDDPLSPESLAGIYPLALVNGDDPGTYHPVGALNCSAAFQTGALTINKNHSFRLELAYHYLCEHPSSAEGPGTLIVTGDDARPVGNTLYLDGCGPAISSPSSCPKWTLDVRLSLSQLAVQFLDEAAQYWGDPLFTMGPRQ